MGTKKIVLIAHLSWFFAGFDLVLLPLLAREIGASYFPNIKPEISILAVYGTFSLSLLARFFGGIILGTAADSYGRKPFVIICLSVMSTLTLFSAFLPSVHDIAVDWTLAVVISFVTLRIVIGFFSGGIWPTTAIFAMEELDELETQKKLGRNGIFEETTKKRTIASAIMQSGFHTGHLIAALISFVLLAALGVTWHGWPIWHNSFYSFEDAFTWRTLCFFGGVFGIIWTIYFRYSERRKKKKKRKEEEEKEHETPSKSESPLKALFYFEYSDKNERTKVKSVSPLKALLSKGENKEYRDILFSFWLILTGLLYMYYSVIIILPEMLVRNEFLIPFHLSPNEAYPFVTTLILVSTLGAHLWLGFFCDSAWKWSDSLMLVGARLSHVGWSRRKSGRVSFMNLVCLLMELRKFWYGFKNMIANFIGIQYAEKTALDDAADKQIKEAALDVIYKNVDIMLIVFIGFILIIFGILYGISFIFLFNLKHLALFWIQVILIYVLVGFIMVAVSGWALIPSLLLSRFPKHFRATASNLAYNGGLAIGFATPFIMLENFLSSQQHTESLIFFTTILAASAIIIGARRLLLSIYEKSKPSPLDLSRGAPL